MPAKIKRLNMDKPQRVEINYTVELQPYHMRALFYYYGIKTRPMVKEWLKNQGPYGLDDLPKKTEEEWQEWENQYE